VKPATLLLLLVSAFAAAARLEPVDESTFPKLVEAQHGKVVLIDFWATWCDPCREELPKLATLEARLRARGLVLITISVDEAEKDAAAYAFLLKSGVRLPGWRRQADSDQNFINSVDPAWSGALPAVFLFDRTGRKAQAFIGETSTEDIAQAVSKLL
jgi:thiol-disulfide isomerase/thioredoxin